MQINPSGGKRPHVSEPPKFCNDCKTLKPRNGFTTLKRFNKTKGLKEFPSSFCKPCMAKRAKAWAARNKTRVFKYESIRLTYRRRKTPVCAYCAHPNGLTAHKYKNQTAFYHLFCIQRLYDQLGIIAPTRVEELRKLSEGGLV